MRLASIMARGGERLAVAVGGDSLVLAEDIVPGLTTFQDLIGRGEAGLASLKAALSSRDASAESLPAAAAHWLAPSPHPGKILNVALNNGALDRHLTYRPTTPTFFSKPVSALQGHGGPVRLKPHYGVTHPEAELGVVIGRGGQDISLETAMDHVLGYTIINDVTSMGMRQEDRFHARTPLDQLGPNGETYHEEVLTYPARYKGCDTFCPMGPWLVLKDEIPDPSRLDIRCWIDDALYFEDNLAHYTYSVAEVIFWISAHVTLEAGDVIAMGTAVNVGKPKVTLSSADMNRFGARVRIEIEGLGVLENPIERVDAPDPRAVFAR